MIIAGLLIGPAIIGQFHPGGFMGIIHPTDAEMDVLQSFSQIGVVFILFSSGLETDFREDVYKRQFTPFVKSLLAFTPSR